MLESDGYIYSTVGRGSFVSEKMGQNEAEKIEAKKKLKESASDAYKKESQRKKLLL